MAWQVWLDWSSETVSATVNRCIYDFVADDIFDFYFTKSNRTIGQFDVRDQVAARESLRFSVWISKDVVNLFGRQ